MYLIKILKYKLILTTVVLFTITQLFAQHSFFTKNQGQVFNQNGAFNKEVNYILSLKDYNVSFYPDHFSYEVFSTNAKDSTILNSERIELWFNQSKSIIKIVAQDKTTDVSNVYKNGRSFENIASYKKITYKEVWEGIDIEFLIYENKLKYNYIVRNQKTKSISLTIKGASVIRDQDDLLLKTTRTSIRESIPESFYLLPNNEKQKKEVQFKIINSNIEFILPKNRKNTYVIDPIAYSNEYTSYYGGAHMDFAQSINTTKTNQVLLSGYTVSTNNIATTGAFQTTLSDQDAFIAAFDNQGVRLWATYFGGEGSERIYTAQLDSNDNVFIAGNTTSITGLATPGVYQQYISSGDDAFITKFSSSGNLIWSTYYGGNAHELITSIEIDDSNKVYVTGHTSSTNLPCTSNAFRSTINGFENAFLGVFNNDGAVVYNSYYIKGSNTRGEGLAITNNGTIYLSGYTNDTDSITFSSVHQNENAGYIDGFIIKLNSQYQLIWKTYIGGEYNDLIEDLTIDSLENIYIAGKTKSSIGISTANSFQPTYSSNWDGFVIKMDSSCVQQWGTYIQAGNNEELTAVKVKDSSIWLLGITNGNSFPTDSSALQTTNNGGFDNLIVNLSDTGGLIWSSYFGGSGDEFGFDLVLDNKQKILIAGQTGTNSNFTTPNAHQTNYGGHIYDGFWTTLCKPLNTTVLSQSGTIYLCEGDSVSISSTNNFNNYLWSNGDTTSNSYLSISGDYLLKTKDINNCPGKSDTLTVNVIPNMNLNLQQTNNAICFEDSVHLSINNTYNSYLWSNGETTSSIYITDGQEYSLTVTNSYGCIYQSDSIQLPLAQHYYTIQIVGDTIICSGGQAVLYTSGLNTVNWSSLETTNVITVNTSGNYWFSGLDTDGCPAISDTITITQVNYNSPSLVLDTSSLFSICWNDSIQLSAEDNFNSYLWSNGDVTQSVTLNEEGYYYVSATDSNGCVGISDSLKITYKTVGISSIIQPQGNEFCQGDSLLLLTPPSLTNISWNSNTISNDSIYIKNNGAFYFTAIDSLGCASLSDTAYIVENSLPDVQIVGGTDSICLQDSLYLSTSTNFNLYNWSNGNQNASNYYALTTLGINTIYLDATDFNNCTNKDSIIITVIDCTPYNNIKEENNIQIILNLMNNVINITSIAEIESLSLYDLNGKIVFNQENIKGVNCNIDSRNIAPSVYILKIQLTNNSLLIIKKIDLIK